MKTKQETFTLQSTASNCIVTSCTISCPWQQATPTLLYAPLDFIGGSSAEKRHLSYSFQYFQASNQQLSLK